MELRVLVLVLVLQSVVCGDVCPKECDCDMDNGLNRAMCVDQNIISIEMGVPHEVQVYVLSHNVISELDNFCFKESGYTSIQVLDLSYNLIFWIGLHAFSSLDKLLHLDLSNNRLRQIPSDLFWDTPELESLDMSGNIFEALKNEPFIMHTRLQVLNLQNCRIKALPDRMFTRLQNLKKLDLSENYAITLSTELLRPLRRLDRLELHNDYWQCTPGFIAIESWILSRRIKYEKQCKTRMPIMLEKMVAMTTEKVDVNISDVWNVTKRENVTLPTSTEKPLTPFQKLDQQFSSTQAFIIGLELGLAIGVIGTYIWLRNFCKCGQLSCTRPQSRRSRRRARDTDARSLLWTNVINPDTETPPLFRRQLPIPQGPVYPTYGLPSIVEAGLQVDAIRLPDRSETPPPPYNECRFSI